MQITHVMKSWTHLFQAMKKGVKKHDLRNKRERHFQVGQVCELQEFDNTTGRYTGEVMLIRIAYITSNDDVPCALSSTVLDDDHCILSVEIVEEE